jgi:hypothetical protein
LHLLLTTVDAGLNVMNLVPKYFMLSVR